MSRTTTAPRHDFRAELVTLAVSAGWTAVWIVGTVVFAAVSGRLQLLVELIIPLAVITLVVIHNARRFQS